MDEASSGHVTPGNALVCLLRLAGRRPEGGTSVEREEGDAEVHYEGGHVYQGTFSRGFLDGAGVFTHASGLTYEGQIVSNLPRGRGRYSWPDGSSYDGDVSGGLRAGRGTFRGAGGVLYCGEWRSGKRHGKGTVFYNQERSSWYRGDWLNGAREGRGERRYPSGNTYSGEWKNNRRHGEGTMRWLDAGQRYAGTWRDGVQHGTGRHVWVAAAVDGSHYCQNNQYVGELAAGRRQGAGTFLYAGGAKYEGQWRKDRKHGQGKLTLADGRVYDGEFVDDRMLTPAGRPAELPPLGGDSDFVLDVGDLLDRLPERSRGNERQQVQFVVLRQTAALRCVYSFYSQLGSTGTAGGPGTGAPLSRVQLWRLLKDCKVHHLGFTLTQIDRFVRGAAGAPDDDSPFHTLPFHNLLNCLVTVAYRVFSHDFPSQKNLLASCLSRLMTENILPHATNVKGFLFRHSGVAAAALRHVEKIWEVYEARSRNVSGRKLLWTFKDLNLLDDRLTPSRFVEILTAESCDPTNPTSCLDLELNFLEFVEVLLGCAEAKCLQASGDLKEDGPGPGPQNTTSRTPQTDDSSGEDVEGPDVTETRRSAGKPGGPDHQLELRIRTVDRFFNDFFFPALDREETLSRRRSEARRGSGRRVDLRQRPDGSRTT